MSLLNKLKTKRGNAFFRLEFSGVGDCLRDNGRQLIVRLLPTQLKEILSKSEMVGVVEMFTKAATPAQGFANQAVKELQSMDMKSQLGRIQEVVEAGKMILRDYAVDCGYESSSPETEAEWVPVKFVETQEELGMYEAKHPDTAVFLFEQVGDGDLIQSTMLMKDIAKNMKKSDQPTIGLKAVNHAGVKEAVSPKDLNQFPEYLGD